MQGQPIRLPPRLPAALAAEETRLPPAVAEQARRRDEGARRQATSANRLMVAVTRQLQEGSEGLAEVEGESNGASGVGESAGASSGGEVAGAPAQKSGKPGGGARMPAVGARRTVGRESSRPDVAELTSSRPEREVAAKGLPGDVETSTVDASGATVGQQPRIERAGRIGRVDRLRPGTGVSEDVDARHRRSSWGGWLAAVVALAAVIALGWFERLGNAEGDNDKPPPSMGRESAGRSGSGGEGR